ncbi:hypothetical protein KQI84_14595 [bacterium]|nr:hypothetical protein [bacterium]
MKLLYSLLSVLFLLLPLGGHASVNAIDYEDFQFPLTGRLSGELPEAAGSASSWSVEASAPGIGLMPSPQIVLDTPGPVLHDEANILEVTVSTSATVALVLTGSMAGDRFEVFPARRISNAEGKVRWMLKQRVGRATDLTSFTLATQFIPDTPFKSEPVIISNPRIIDARLLSDSEVIQASPFRALVPNYTMPAGANTVTQQVSVVLPGVLAVRGGGRDMKLLLDGRPIADMKLDVEKAEDASLYTRTFTLPNYGEAGDTRDVRLLLHLEGQKYAVLDRRILQILPPGRVHGQFEQPFRSIRDYEIAESGGDMLVVAILDDLYSHEEPQLAATASHDVVANILSPYTGKFESRDVWRVPAYGHSWEGGFQSIGIGRREGLMAVFLSGLSAQGIESISMAGSAGSGVFRPVPANPILEPGAALSGKVDGEPFAMRGNSVVDYGDSYALLSWTQVGGKKPRLLSFVSPDIRYWVEAGAVPNQLPTNTRHIALSHRGELYYMTTDDPHRVWVSADPLRHWQPFDVDFPEDWRAFRLRRIGNTEYIFGLFEYEGRSILRWRECKWSADKGIPLPVMTDEPSPTRGF